MIIGSNVAVPGKTIIVTITSDGTDDDESIFALDGDSSSNAYFKVGRGNGQVGVSYIEGGNTTETGRNNVVAKDISTESSLSAEQQIFFETVGYDSAGSYSGTLQFNFSIRDDVVPVTEITLNETSTSILVGGNKTLEATVTPTDATYKFVNWSTSNPAVATVDTNGTVTGVAAGTAVITATAIDGKGAMATCEVTVNSQ